MGADVKTSYSLGNKKGFALMEAMVFLVAFVVLIVYVIDFFTVIHTGIVHSIAARTYLFETLQHRNDLALLRQGPASDLTTKNPLNPSFAGDHYRFHAVT